jgi:hypothetical protein
VNAQTETGCTALIAASCEGHMADAKELLDHGAGTDVTDSVGLTALHFARSKFHLAVIKELLDHGANSEVTNIKSRTAIWPLSANCFAQEMKFAPTIAMVQSLVSSASAIVVERITRRRMNTATLLCTWPA